MKDIHAIVIEIDGTVTNVTLEHDGDSHAGALNREVGGYFDHVNLRSDMDMWVHDMGAYELQPNPYASVIADAVVNRQIPLFGRVVVTGGVGDDGDTLALSQEAEQVIRETITLVRENWGPVIVGRVATRIHIWACDAVGRSRELTPITPGWEWKVQP